MNTSGKTGCIARTRKRPHMAQHIAPDAETTTLLRTLITALEDKKAEKLKVLNVGGVSDITDYLVLATGNSEPHLRALRIEAEKVLDAAKAKIAGMDSGGFNSGWTVVDAYQIMIHFFTSDQREAYSLEKLWKDAPEVDLNALFGKPSVVKAAKPKEAKPKVAKAAKPASPVKAPKAAGAARAAAVKKKTPVKKTGATSAASAARAAGKAKKPAAKKPKKG